MSGNVHGHQLPKKGINVNPNNPVFARHEPESVPAEIPQGLHGAPALRSEMEPAADTSPVVETKVYADGSSATGVAPLPNLSPEEQAKAEQAAAEAQAEAQDPTNAESSIQEAGPSSSPAPVGTQDGDTAESTGASDQPSE